VSDAVYKSGDIVPRSGLYRIDHDQHRLMHEATLTAGMLFPRCRTCKDGVRFTLIRAVKGYILPFRANEILEDYPEMEDSAAFG
jgi:hypothetical protein